MTHGLEKAATKTGWEVLAFVWMPNHIHLFLRTPQPNLSQGMQYLLSGYANWHAKRHRRAGHLFQGRFKGELVEDETYFWTVSRCQDCLDWIAYDFVYDAWPPASRAPGNGWHPQRAYRRFVESGIKEAPANPFRQALAGWLLGSEAFLEKTKSRLTNSAFLEGSRAARRAGTWRRRLGSPPGQREQPHSSRRAGVGQVESPTKDSR